jgi:predicted Zn-dependent protease
MPETLVIEDPAFLAALTRVVREQPHVASQTMSPSRHFQRIILAAIVSVVGLVSLSVWGIPLLAELAAPFVPMTFETHLGEVVLKEVAPEVDRCTDPQLQQALETIITRLATKTRGSDYRFHLTVVDQPAMNAIALPGGSIVLYRKLLQQTDTPDELAGVLAHEMQHIVHQHGTKALLHDLGLSLLIGAVMGDVSGMTAIAVQAGRTMTTLRHSRDAEEEADRDGMILLLAAHLDPAGMIRFFDTLQQEQGGPAIPQYLSTHPDTEARIAHLKDLAAGLPVQVESLPLTEEWHALRDRCRDEPKG